MEIEKLYYFAYGSNLSLSRLIERVGGLGKVKRVGSVVLPGYSLTFDCGWRTHSYANVKKADSDEYIVEGVGYELSDAQISRLDFYEGWPYHYTKFYFRDHKGRMMFGYWSMDKYYSSNALPDIKYLNYLITGARENNLTATLAFLEKYKESILQWV